MRRPETSADISMEKFYAETGVDPNRLHVGPVAFIDNQIYTAGEVTAPVDIVDRDKEPKPDDAFRWSPPSSDEIAPPQTPEQRGLEERDGWA